MKTEIIHALIEQLDHADAALGTPLAVPRNEAAFQVYWNAKRTIHQARIELSNTPQDVAAVETKLQRAIDEHQASSDKQADLERQLAERPDWTGIQDRGERDAEFDRQRTLHQQLQLLRGNQLFRAPGVVFENPEDCLKRVQALTVERDRLAQRLEQAIANAEQLISTTASTSAAPTAESATPVPVAK